MLVADANWITTQDGSAERKIIVSETVKGYVPLNPTFTLQVGTAATTPLAWDSSANAVKAALATEHDHLNDCNNREEAEQVDDLLLNLEVLCD